MLKSPNLPRHEVLKSPNLPRHENRRRPKLFVKTCSLKRRSPRNPRGAGETMSGRSAAGPERTPLGGISRTFPFLRRCTESFTSREKLLFYEKIHCQWSEKFLGRSLHISSDWGANQLQEKGQDKVRKTSRQEN